MGIPPAEHALKIFDSQPPADLATFQSGLQGLATNEQIVSIILFSPNLHIIASLDNANSAITSTYTVSFTQGFTFTAGQSVSITAEAGVNIEVFSAKISTTFALSFSEAWNKQETKTMSFSCPPGKMAFVYQGTLMSRVLVEDAGTGGFSWNGNAAKAYTQVLKTTDTPIGIAPSNPVTIGSA